jgi:hypothetical protein
MKVFLSWSGNRSKAVAELLSEWLSCVIQAVRPWISTRDLDRGSLWFGEINDQLQETTIGIICLTQENRARPWILFEAGALAKGLSTSRVCTFLIDLDPQDIEDPLAQFNHTLPTKEGIHSLVKTLNNALGSNGLDIRTLDQVFETYWPQLEYRFSATLKETISAEPAKPRDKEDILGEILENTRLTSLRVRKLEAEIDRSRKLTSLATGTPLGLLRDAVYQGMKAGISREAMMGKLKGEFSESESIELEKLITEIWDHSPFKEKA